MRIIELIEKENFAENIKLRRIYVQFGALLGELKKKELPQKTIEFVNHEIKEVNAAAVTAKELGKMAKEKQTKIIEEIENELKIAPKNYYRNMWLAMGIAAFGLPIGIAFGFFLDNFALLAIGLPIGMAIGLALGSKMDKKAFQEGRQLNIEFNR